MTPIDVARSILRKAGLDLRKYRPASRRRIVLMESLGVRTVLDVGANVGQYGTELRESGFRGAIVSFEPLGDAFRRLVAASAGDASWSCVQVAASDEPGTSKINVAANSASSSLLTMAEAHNDAAPEAMIIGFEEVTLSRLDAVDDARSAVGPLMLKLDVQGHELAALEGAGELLDRVVLIEAELSVCELYEGGPLMPDVLTAMAERGFELVALEPGFHDPRDGRILQFDGYFRRV